MPPSTKRAERVVARDKSKQLQLEQGPPKKKPRKGQSSSLVKQGAQQPRTTSLDSTKPSCEDYNERTPERTDLLTQFQSLLKVDRISSTFWACCQLSDMESLQLLVKIAEKSPTIVLGYDDYLSTM